MKKEMYVTPAMETVQVEACDMMAQSVRSDSLGMGFGGDASGHHGGRRQQGRRLGHLVKPGPTHTAKPERLTASRLLH